MKERDRERKGHREEALGVCSRVSPPWQYRHFGLHSSLFWRAVLCTVEGLVATLASTNEMLRAFPSKYLQTLPNGPGVQNNPWLRTSKLL